MKSPRHPSRDYDYSLHYRIWHKETEEHARFVARHHATQLRRFLPPASSAPVLDVGCGMGFALLALRDLGFSTLAGIDTDERQAAVARRHGLAVDLVDDSVAYLSERPDRYEVVLLLDMLEHVPVAEQITFMRAINTALRPGGRVILTVPNATSILSTRWRYIDYTHHCAFTEHSLRFVLLNAGFPEVDIPRDGHLDPPRRPSLRLWRRSVRAEWPKWIVRYLWRHAITAELRGIEPGVDDISIELNLTAVAVKPSPAPAA